MAKKKMNELQLTLISYCTNLYVGYIKQAFEELFPVPQDKKTSREQLFLDRLSFLSKEFNTRVTDIAQLSDVEAKAYLEKIVFNLEKQRNIIPKEDEFIPKSKNQAKPQAKQPQPQKGEEYKIKFD